MIPEKLAQEIAAADYVVGSDECGYGAWAGPLVVCAAIIPKNWSHASYVKDSKDFSGANKETKRIEVCRKIIPSDILFSVLGVSHEEIDRVGVWSALKTAHRKAIDQVLLKHKETGRAGKVIVIVDGNIPFEGAFSLPKADALVPAVSAASILGKVTRDKAMIALAVKYPGYGFEKHKGYGGGADHAHTVALDKLGPCEIHRKSYSPIRARLKGPAENGLFDLATSGELDD